MALCERLGGGYWAVMEAPAWFVDEALVLMTAEAEHRERQSKEQAARPSMEDELARRRAAIMQQRGGAGRE